MIVEMYKTAVYFDTHHNYPSCDEVAKTVSVRRESCANKLCSVCITVAVDGIKLPLFVILKDL